MENAAELLPTIASLIGSGFVYLSAVVGAIGLLAMVATSILTTVSDLNEAGVA